MKMASVSHVHACKNPSCQPMAGSRVVYYMLDHFCNVSKAIIHNPYLGMVTSALTFANLLTI